MCAVNDSSHRPIIEKQLKDESWSINILNRLGISSSKVRKVSAAFKVRGYTFEMPKSGWSRTVDTCRVRGIIKKWITRNNGVSTNRIALDLKVSHKFNQIIIKNELELESYWLSWGKFLSNQSKQNQLVKPIKLIDELKVCGISDVIWTDEIFTVKPPLNSQNQRQLLSIGDKKSPKRHLAHNRFFPKSVMVWVGTSESGFGGFHWQKCENQLGGLPKTRFDGQFVALGRKSFCSATICALTRLSSKSTEAILHKHFPWQWTRNCALLLHWTSPWWIFLESKISEQSYKSVDALKSVLLKV